MKDACLEKFNQKRKLYQMIMNWCLIMMDLWPYVEKEPNNDKLVPNDDEQVPNDKNQCLIMMNLCLIIRNQT